MSPISENVFLYVCMPTSSELISSTQQNRFQHRDHCRTPMSTRHISSTSSTTLYTTVYFLDQRIPNYMSLTIVGRRAYSFDFNYFMLWTSTRCDIIKAIILLTGMVVGMQRVNSWSELSCAEYGPVPLDALWVISATTSSANLLTGAKHSSLLNQSLDWYWQNYAQLPRTTPNNLNNRNKFMKNRR